MHIGGGSVLPNCVGYAWGRWLELLDKKPRLSRANAEDWWAYGDGYERGQSPRLGAVICWSKGRAGNGSDGAGHVAVVEKILSSTKILTSESGYGSSIPFWTKTRQLGDGNWGQKSKYIFQGFIYLPENFEEEMKKVTIEINVLKKGAKGEDVKALQRLLNGNGQQLEVDGSFGGATERALMDYQRAKDLEADGSCGRATWSSLLGA